MTWIKTIDREDATGRLKKVYDKISSDEKTSVSEVFKMHSLNPWVMEASASLFKNIMYGSSGLTRSEREMVAVIVSKVNQCHY